MDTPKIAFCSDLHFEFHRNDLSWMPELCEDADILILVGDIDVGKRAIKSIRRITEQLPNAEIIYVAGNHEFYNQNINETIEYYREVFSKDSRVHFLENESVTLFGYRFIGATLWSGFDAFTEYPLTHSLNNAKRSIQDFHSIRISDDEGERLFTPSDAREFFRESVAWITSELKIENSNKTIVITHFPPHTDMRHKAIPIDALSNYFVADCNLLIETYQPTAWLYGHNHWSDTKKIGNTIVASNQLGYPSENNHIPKYQQSMILEKL